MTAAAFNGVIEVVRGRLSEEREGQLLRFWAEQGVLDASAARRRAPEVVCLLLDDAGEIAGVNSVYPDGVAQIGGRRFWIYRSLLLPAASEEGPAMISAAFDALEEEFDAAGDGPIGLCLLISDRAEMRRRPEAEWSDPQILYAGYLPDGRQLRIGYFAGAKI
jgi:hypothetical protein